MPLQENNNKTPQLSTPYKTFINTINRCTNMLTFLTEKLNADKGEMTQEKLLVYDDFLRSICVLIISAMDNYFTQKFASILVPYLYKKTPGKQLVLFLEESGVNTEMALELISSKKPMVKIRNLVKKKLEKYTTQNTETINKLFLLYGIKDFCQNIEKKSGKKTLLKDVIELVNKRHEIVHNGDINKYYKVKPLNINKVAYQITTIPVFISNAEDILNNLIE